MVDAEQEMCALSKLYPACMKRPECAPVVYFCVVCVGIMGRRGGAPPAAVGVESLGVLG